MGIEPALLPDDVTLLEVSKIITVILTEKIFYISGGDIILSNSTFLTFCGKSDLKLRITLDTRNDVMESNELNNVVYINGVTLTDGNADFCSSKLLFGRENRYQLMYCD